MATLKAAAVRAASRGPNDRIRIIPSDLKQKVRERRAGYTILFVVDASSSMRGKGRMSHAKALLHAYLKESYLRRDRVGLVAFHHDRSRLALPLTPNMRRAEHVVEQLALGGKTPLAEGIALGLRALLQERYRNPETDTVMVLVSDGKPNLSLHGGDPLEEALMVAERVAQNRTALVFIDTEDDPLAFGYGPQVARAAGGVYRTMASLMKD
ncbi:MAG: VWA domain-containing protein [Deltaproteobacteria bacterium]|nr:VWA domain-containing protein [Deltaproteobacteria bacterium]